MSAGILALTTVLLAGGFVFGIHEAGKRLGLPAARAKREALAALAVVSAWILADAGLALSGILGDFTRTPPPMVVFAVLSFVFATWLGLSGFGDRLARGLPLAWLVGFQSFRLLAELAIYLAYKEGRAPVQMTFEGANFDILTGVGAMLVAPLVWKKKWRVVALTWNWGGLLLLANVVVVAILSLPTSLRMFMNQPANTWVTEFPYVWLPGILVQFAWLGHLLVFRKLRRGLG